MHSKVTLWMPWFSYTYKYCHHCIVFVFNSFPRRISLIYFYEAYDIVVYLISIFIFNKKQCVKHIEKLIISFWENTPEKKH